MRNRFHLVLLGTAFALFGTACKKEKSAVTGWNYNDAKWGGFETYDYAGQETGPGLVYVKGGAFTMGSSEHDVLYDRNNYERKASVHSFYMDETEISNLHYLEYLHWLRRVFVDYPEVYLTALPDTNCWRDKLAYNEPYVDYYFRHPAYKNYPVVGVNWLQANAYAAWRTDRVNEMILIREGILKPDINQMNEENFNTDAYLQGQYQSSAPGKHLIKDIRVKKGTRNVRMEDGIFLPDYRLPTEAEWEYAAIANIGSSQYENTNNKKIYSWGGLTVRNHDGKEKNRGLIMENFKRGKGDQMGISSQTNDGAFITTEVKAYWPNDHGLYNMSGNVSEWVMDVYRPLSYDDETDVNPFRGNVYTKPKLDEDGVIDLKDSLGRIVYVPVEERDNVIRRNYKKSDNIGFLDEEFYNEGDQQYEYGVTSLVNNKARVYKGGSWNDRAYWMSPGTRRFLDEQQSLSTLGFRLAMHRVGAP
ncbi:MAG: SUMF1/EgtB/PvdO family nonheme iron enzyme [Flavobacteriales bacterium]|nr:SUMF1/EgtB/PvdO family nonheme iron enzyme [Flavobacteriales bacterium]